MKVKICIAKNAGFCFGVRRAADIVAELRKQTDEDIFTAGELIHNKTFIDRLCEDRIFCVSENNLSKTLNQYPLGNYVIRTHGVTKEISEMFENKSAKYIDATCPYVKRIHDIVENNTDIDTHLIIIGNRDHPEVQGIKSYAKGPVFIFSNKEEITEKIINEGKILTNNAILVAQTTYNHEKYVNCQNVIKKLYTNIIIFDTICSVTEKRQVETTNLAKKSDIMIVIGGQKSSNSQKLFEISQIYCKHSYFVQTFEEIPIKEILLIKKERELLGDLVHDTFTVGITAGASTPDDIIEEVQIRMTNLFEIYSDETTNAEETATPEVDKKPELSEDMSFAEMLDASFRTMRPGERVNGIVTSVSPTEVHVDLGIKHTGIIPHSEITDNPSEELEDLMKPGDAIEVVVMKFNDAEGTVALSKKRIDADKHWQVLVDAADAGEVVSGKVIEIVKGGLIMLAAGNRIFIPASQTTLPRSENLPGEKELSVFMGQEVKVKILDTNKQRKRAVGSMRVALREERRAQEAHFWETAKVDQSFTGKVKSITHYGAFVDLGGVDGMVHITELSWKRIKHPTEVVNIGDEITVFIKSLDEEKRRISLGYKTEDQNPWNLFNEKYTEGDIAEVRIVSLMPFGAFAEVLPGVDGLIHISQISDKKIGKPSDELKIGDVVQVKITSIDQENQKISLSIRALLEPQEEDMEEVLADQKVLVASTETGLMPDESSDETQDTVIDESTNETVLEAVEEAVEEATAVEEESDETPKEDESSDE